MAIYWPTPGLKGRPFKLCVLTRWDFNFCVRSSPLRVVSWHNCDCEGVPWKQNAAYCLDQSHLLKYVFYELCQLTYFSNFFHWKKSRQSDDSVYYSTWRNVIIKPYNSSNILISKVINLLKWPYVWPSPCCVLDGFIDTNVDIIRPKKYCMTTK